MNRTGIIYLIASILAVCIVSFCVLMPDTRTNDTDITVTVMNTGTVIRVSDTAAETTILSTKYHVTTGTCTSATEFPSISTNTEPVETVTEQVCEEIFIDINSADVQELMKLDGIGEVTANEIISYREQHGGFGNIEEIIDISGIGTVKFENIRDYIYVENPVYNTGEVPEEFTEPETEPEIITEEEQSTEISLADIAPVNINTAGIEELILLPNVNEQIAQDIITLREKLHGFSHVYELLYVEKLEQKQVAEMEEFVTVGQ